MQKQDQEALLNALNSIDNDVLNYEKAFAEAQETLNPSSFAFAGPSEMDLETFSSPVSIEFSKDTKDFLMALLSEIKK